MPKNFNTPFEEAAYWRLRARPDRAPGIMHRRRLRRENAEYLGGLLIAGGPQIGYHGTTAANAELIPREGFHAAYKSAEYIYAWPAKVALEAMRDMRHLVSRMYLDGEGEGSVLEVAIAEPRPDPSGALRWAAAPEAMEVQQVFAGSNAFFRYIAEKAAQDPEAYDGRDMFAL